MQVPPPGPLPLRQEAPRALPARKYTYMHDTCTCMCVCVCIRMYVCVFVFVSVLYMPVCHFPSHKPRLTGTLILLLAYNNSTGAGHGLLRELGLGGQRPGARPRAGLHEVRPGAADWMWMCGRGWMNEWSAGTHPPLTNNTGLLTQPPLVLLSLSQAGGRGGAGRGLPRAHHHHDGHERLQAYGTS